MSIPFPEAATRSEARDNAIYLAMQAEETLGNTQAPTNDTAHLASVWSQIALSFPEDPVLVDNGTFNGFHPVEDHRPYPASEETAVIPTQHVRTVMRISDTGTDTITVEAASWDVLRYLAAVYLCGMPDRRTVIDLEGVQREGQGYEVHLLRMPDSSNVHIVYEQP